LSSFEFAQIPMAIILGFGITEILATWGYQLRNRGRAPWSPLHFAASAWVLLLSVRYIWIQWGWRGIEWTYVDYVMAVGPALALALAAHVAKIDVATPRSHPIYEQSRRPLCLLLAAWVALSLARGTVSPIPDSTVIGAQAGMLLPTLAVVLGTLVWLGLSRTPARHGFGWALLWAAQVWLTIHTFRSIGVG
jgi:hypothetical protein